MLVLEAARAGPGGRSSEELRKARGAQLGMRVQLLLREHARDGAMGHVAGIEVPAMRRRR
jgi:hypothetical protein